MENREKFLDEGKKQEMKERYLRDFRAFRDECLDDLPPQRLLPGDPDYHRYKCRGNFWNAVAAKLENLRDFGIISGSQEADQIDGFISFLRTQAPKPSKFATKEDIDEINKLLDRAMEILA